MTFKKKLIVLALLSLIIFGIIQTIPPKYYYGESPNFKQERFWNSFDTTKVSRENRPKGSFFKWQMERRKNNVSWKNQDVAKFINYADYQKLEKSEDLSVVFIGHASFLIQVHGVNFLTDPIWSERASPVSFLGPKRYSDPGVKIKDLPTIDYVLLSHSHYDHLDIPTIKILKKEFDPTFITGLGLCNFLNKKKKLNVKCIEKDWGEGVKMSDDFNVFFEKAKHWSKRTLVDSNETLWGSFVLKSKKYNIFFSGDTGFANHFQMIKDVYGSFDISLIGIGAYKPDYIMKSSHLSPFEAVEAHKILQSKQSFGMHLKTFQLSDETFNEPVEDLERAMKEAKLDIKTFRVLDFGERFTLYK